VSSVQEYNKDPWNDLSKYIKRKAKYKTDDKIQAARESRKLSKVSLIENSHSVLNLVTVLHSNRFKFFLIVENQATNGELGKEDGDESNNDSNDESDNDNNTMDVDDGDLSEDDLKKGKYIFILIFIIPWSPELE